MPIYNFNPRNVQVSSAGAVPDMRSDIEKEFSQLSLFNHDKPDLGYAETMAEELINLSGAWVTVFKKIPKGDNEDKEVWDEDADPLYTSGSDIKAYIKVDTVSYEYTRWGIDNPLKLKIIFSRAAILRKFADKLIVLGDVIRVPYGAAFSMLAQEPRQFFFRVLNAYDSGNFMYRWLYYTAMTELLTGDKAIKIRHE
jgi:hypothetical protein